MNRTRLLILFVFLLFIPTVISDSQVQTLGGIDGYPPGTDITLIQVCPNCTYINITAIKLGDGSILEVDSSMTKKDTFYYYNLSKGNTTSVGEYIVNWEADPNGKSASGSYNLYVRKGGLFLTTGQAILYIFLLLLAFAAFLFFFMCSINIPYSDQRNENGTISKLISRKYLKLFSIWISYGMFLLFLTLLIGIVNTFTYLDPVLNILTRIYLFMYWIAYILTTVILMILFIEVWKDILIPIFKVVLKWASNRKK